MKKSFLAAIALMLTSAAFAQVDSTSQTSPSNDYSKSETQTDTVSTIESDTLSNQGSGSSIQMPSSLDSTSMSTSDSTSTSSTSTSTSDSTSAVITDDDIRNYAQVMDSVNTMKKVLLGEITDMVKGNPKTTVSRYMELSKATGDEAKLTELKATPDEIAFVKEVSDFKNEGAGEISEKFQTLVKEIGVEKYNAIKDQLETDTAMKAKYEAIMVELKQDDAEASNSGSKTGTKATSSSKSSTK